MPTIHLLIKGKVQGVSYRVSAREAAEKLHLTGWIKNTRQGDVEAMVTGEEGDLQEFIIWCKIGPSGAVVAEVVAIPAAETSFTNFLIVRD